MLESSPGPSPKGHHTHVTHNTKNESSALLQRILLLSASSRSCAEGPALGASSRVEIQDANCSCSKTSSRRRCLAARAALLQLRARDAMPLADAFLFKEFLEAPLPVVGNQGAVIWVSMLEAISPWLAIAVNRSASRVEGPTSRRVLNGRWAVESRTTLTTVAPLSSTIGT